MAIKLFVSGNMSKEIPLKSIAIPITNFGLNLVNIGTAKIDPTVKPRYTKEPKNPILTLFKPTSVFIWVIAAGMTPWSKLIRMFVMLR